MFTKKSCAETLGGCGIMWSRAHQLYQNGWLCPMTSEHQGVGQLKESGKHPQRSWLQWHLNKKNKMNISSERPQLKTGSSRISMWRWSPARTYVRVRSVAAKRCQTHPAETNSARARAPSYLSQLARFQPKLGIEGNHWICGFCWGAHIPLKCHEFLSSAWVALAGIVEKCQGG